MKKEYFISLGIVVVGVGAALYILSVPTVPFSKNNPAGGAAPAAPIQSASAGAGARVAAVAVMAHTTLLPHASETYQVMQVSSTLPKIVQATIDPLGVHVGDTQHLSVVLQDPNTIVSAEALIQTDHGTTTLPLVLAGPTRVSELLPQKYYINSQNNLAFVSSAAPVATVNGKGAMQGIALAATGGDSTYTGSWLVHDTHDTTYTTTFIVKDSAGNTNAVTMAWSDACSGFPLNGAGTLSGNCAVSSIDGVENGNVNIGSVYTLTLSAPLVYNPGYNINISGGTISIGTGGALERGYLYAMDADGDGYAQNGSIIFSTSSVPSGGHVHRYSLTGTGDCDDTDSNVHPGQVGYFTNISNGGTWDYNCDGSVTKEYPATTTAQCNSSPACSGITFSCNNTSIGNPGWGTMNGYPSMVAVPSCGSTGTYDIGGCQQDLEAPGSCSGHAYPSQDCNNRFQVTASTTQACN